jgi:hypothetical protein
MSIQIDYEKIFQELSNTFEMPKVTTTTSPDFYFREFSTIKFDGGRQTGKTAWAIKKLKDNPSFILITVNEDLKKLIVSSIPSIADRVLSPEEIDIGILKYNYIIIDDGSYLSHRYDTVVKILADNYITNSHSRIVLLG